MQRYSDAVQDPAGNALSGVSVLVQDEDGNSATVYSDNGVTPTANPLTTDAEGEFSFYAADGVYTLTFSGGGAAPKTKEVQLWDYRVNGPKVAQDVAGLDFSVATGTTDQTTALNAALAVGKAVQLGDGTVTVEDNNGATTLTTAADSALVGRGDKTILDLEEQSATGTSEWFTVGAAGFTLQNLKIKFSKVASGLSTALMLKTRASRIALRRVSIDGQTALAGGVQDRSVQIVKSHNVGSADSVDIVECDITGAARAYTRDNADTNTQKIVKVALSKFRNFWRTTLTFNAPGGYIDDVLVVGNTFDTHAGIVNADSAMADNNNAVGAVGVRGGRVIGNHVAGSYGAVVHIEENTDGLVVIGNTARMANESATDGAMETTANNVSGVAVVPHHLAHIGNVIQSTDGVGTGFWIQNGVSSDGARWSIYQGNISQGFDDAFKTSTDARSVLIADNVLRGTTNGLDLNRASLLARGNVVANSTVPIVTVRGGLMGSVHFVNLTSATGGVTAFGSTTAGRLALTEWTWETDLFTVSNGAQFIDIGPMPTRIFGFFTIALTSGGADNRTAVFETSYDGATVTNTSKLAFGAGDITINGPAVNGGNFAIQITDASGPTSNCRLQVRFHGGAFVI